MNLCFFSRFQAILAGDFILSAASMALARIGNNAVVSVLSQVIEDLVRGMRGNIREVIRLYHLEHERRVQERRGWVSARPKCGHFYSVRF